MIDSPKSVRADSNEEMTSLIGNTTINSDLFRDAVALPRFRRYIALNNTLKWGCRGWTSPFISPVELGEQVAWSR